jgi:hypothetical protein
MVVANTSKGITLLASAAGLAACASSDLAFGESSSLRSPEVDTPAVYSSAGNTGQPSPGQIPTLNPSLEPAPKEGSDGSFLSDATDALGKALTRPLRSVELMLEDPLTAVSEGVGRALRREALRGFSEQAESDRQNGLTFDTELDDLRVERFNPQLGLPSNNPEDYLFDPFASIRFSSRGTSLFLEPTDDRGGNVNIKLNLPSGSKFLKAVQGDISSSHLWQDIDIRLTYSLSAWDNMTAEHDGGMFFFGFTHQIGPRR